LKRRLGGRWPLSSEGIKGAWSNKAMLMRRVQVGKKGGEKERSPKAEMLSEGAKKEKVRDLLS